MFLSLARSNSGYTRVGQQWGKGNFLFLFSRKPDMYWTHQGVVIDRSVLNEEEFAHKRENRTSKYTHGDKTKDTYVELHNPDYIRNEHGGMMIKGFVVPNFRLTQCGHFMVGGKTLKLPDGTMHRFVASGSYGNDGLTCDGDEKLWPLLHELPVELQDEFWKGGGYNTAGAEGPSIRKWAIENLKMLKRFKKEVTS